MNLEDSNNIDQSIETSDRTSRTYEQRKSVKIKVKGRCWCVFAYRAADKYHEMQQNGLNHPGRTLISWCSAYFRSFTTVISQSVLMARHDVVLDNKLQHRASWHLTHWTITDPYWYSEDPHKMNSVPLHRQSRPAHTSSTLNPDYWSPALSPTPHLTLSSLLLPPLIL